MAYERKFPTTNQTSKKSIEPTGTESTEEDAVDRSSRISPNTTRSASATRRNPNDLSIPQVIVDYFKKYGYSLRWVSVVDATTKSFSNSRVNHFISIGGDLVTAKDIKAVDSSFLQGMVKYDYREEFADDEDLSRGNQQGIRKGDLVLMKLPMEYVKSLREDNARTVQDQIATTKKDYLKRGLEVKQYKSKSGVQQVNGNFFDS